MPVEFGILYYLQTLHTPWLDPFMVFISSICDHGEIWIAIAAVLLCFKRTRIIGIAMVLSMLTGYLLGNMWMKNFFGRQRPCWIDPSVQLLVRNPADFSFPSGHSLISFEGAVSIWLRNKKWGAAALVPAVLIAFSRLYLFVHFPSDVLVGSFMGTGIALVVYRVMQKLEGRMRG